MADLLAHPPAPKQDVPGRDWRLVPVGELVKGQQLMFVEMETTVEDACQLLIDHNLSSVPIRKSLTDKSVCGSFDYSDVSAYLLLIMGVYTPEDEEDIPSFRDLARKARTGSSVPVKLVKDLGKKTPLVTVAESEGLARVVEIFGSGVHRVAVVKGGTDQVVGILSQLQLIGFFWEHGRSFPSIDQLYPCSLRDLNIGSARVISINGDKKVIEAIELMNTEGISSLAVVDNQYNVLGNISTADVKYLTRTSSIPLLHSTCLHFISVILTDRGTANGQDSYPVFHVHPQSTLAHTIAKLVATKAHRMWLVESPSPASSAPPTPTIAHTMAMPPLASPLTPVPTLGSKFIGRLIGVISLTDILNLFARSSGLSPVDPNEARKQRRRSSSSSIRMSFDIPRSSFELRRPPGAA
ncbi:hypothetical protein L211DRAFT_783175 [Terfezia boudieri ATCC MYA-4762]|uniref:Protein SDS23 n=1 Tax=Terfezia boudieri ATCC MYA-4762 TaxID=1051890 RepID=A0A3N4LY23_9PEZI|nr:hypothetical protein L211DRAFT_783175 [Terfezia boudieri ATCC MYA-4762]